MKKSDRRQAKPDLFETAETVPNSTTPVKFSGTDNPRHLRAIHALLVRPVPREQLDRVAGCSNGPDLIAALRDMGLGKDGLPCTKVPDRDRDGFAIRRGVYSLSEAGRRAVNVWLRKRTKGVK
ncbi:hypothetical protein RCH09_003367 [Actimicrobium sp. GrIS 1.19]|uniref:hypothetical protein n=1 Tax=Actimicrobium sp. GrIS 1.19 TaxID=3071708 RepID=UPI002DF799C3|nr:hypothetical protein [Actimicrobium sp. GrIS 1.19]